MENLKILRILSHVHGLVEINGTMVGETQPGEMSLYAPEGRFFLTFTPLASPKGQVALPFGRILDLSAEPPEILSNDGLIELFLLGKDIQILRLFPPTLPLPDGRIPCILASQDFTANGHRYTGMIYFDRTVNFAVQDASQNILFATPVGEEITHPRVFLQSMGTSLFCFAEGRQKDGNLFLLCTSLLPEISLCFSRPCHSYQITGEELLLYQSVDDLSGYLLLEHYALENHRLIPGGRELVPAEEDTSREASTIAILHRLILAVRFGEAELALSCLSPTLRSELNFSDLQEFFGEFSGLDEDAPENDSQIALRYPITANVYLIRVFSFSFVGFLIANISEE